MSEATKADESADEVVDQSLEDDEGLYEMQESSLSYFGADFDVRGLVQRLRDEDIVIPRFDPDESDGATLAGFQRQRVWTKPKMEQFIESLLLGWPVPSIFLVLDSDQRYLVLDGQQRLTALEYFFAGKYPDGRDFKLVDVATHLQDATYETLSSESKRRLNNTFIQATVIEPRGEDGAESVYRLFGRLNSGGVSLTAQEIRVALFLGPAVDWIRKLNSDSFWRALFGKPSPRLKDHELILRALSMYEVLQHMVGHWDDDATRRSAYEPPMSDHLNSYLSTHRQLNELDTDAIGGAFRESVALLYAAAERDGLRFNGRINAAHVDATLSVLMWLQQRGNLPSRSDLRDALNELRDDAMYVEYVTQSTSHRENVYGRLRLALDKLGQ